MLIITSSVRLIRQGAHLFTWICFITQNFLTVLLKTDESRRVYAKILDGIFRTTGSIFIHD